MSKMLNLHTLALALSKNRDNIRFWSEIQTANSIKLGHFCALLKGNNMKFTIIENDEICVFINKKVLLKADKNVEMNAFTEAQDALDFFEENHASHTLLPDVILLDIDMPVMNGWGFLREFSNIMHKLAKVPAIYVLSSTLWPPELERISSHPMVTGFISKPFNLENAARLLHKAR